MKKHVLTSIILCSSILLSLTGCSAETPTTATQSEVETTAATEASETTTEATTTATEATVPDNSDDVFVSAYPAFAVTSESLHDGKWDEITANTLDGQNASPQLSWEPVDGATTYAIYMIDMDTYYFIHWRSGDITETTLPEGWASTTDYIGPYPPEGSTHHYTVYVVALKAPVEKVMGGINAVFPKASRFFEALDTDAEGNTGNIVAVGRITGSFKG